MQIGKPVILVLILLLSFFSGCMFPAQTKFSLISLAVDDDAGFSRLHIRFNNSNDVTLTLQDPTNKVVSSHFYYYGIHNESIYLSGYRTNSSPGTYTILVKDSQKNLIYNHELSFNGSDLSILQVTTDWWEEKPFFSLVGLLLKVKNDGDLPAYPYNIHVQSPTTSSEALVVPTVVLPLQTTMVQCFVYIPNFSKEETTLNVSVLGKSGELLAKTSRSVTPSASIPSWEYQWYYLGSHTLKIPAIEWLYTYYNSLSRFDTSDYAAYVFDPFDDPYLSLVSAKLLLLSPKTTSETERIDFIASFVQGIEYAKDDPLNDSYEYPKFPLETLKEQRGDCEDKAILTAALLSCLGTNVTLLRLPHHMAVGIHLPQPLSGYPFYIDQYYFLETTVLHMPIGEIPPEYQGLSNITMYSITSRPLLFHFWKNATRFQMSNGTDYVYVKMMIENIGTQAASDVEICGAFFDSMNGSYNLKTTHVAFLPQNEKQIIELTFDVPPVSNTTLKTQLVFEGFVVHQRESVMRFS